MNIFSGLKLYAQWKEVATRKFTSEEIGSVKSAEVISSQYGLSVCFMMKGGGQTYIPLSSDSCLAEGDSVDLAKAEIVTLQRAGEENIYRVRI